AQNAREVQLAKLLSRLDVPDFAYRWKAGGCAWGDTIIEGAVSPAPSDEVASYFVNFLDAEIPDARYFLTSNAAAGIIRRADTVGRTLFAPFRQALENMILEGGNDSNVLPGDLIDTPSICKTRPL